MSSRHVSPPLRLPSRPKSAKPVVHLPFGSCTVQKDRQRASHERTPLHRSLPPRAARERDRRWGAAAAASTIESLRGKTRWRCIRNSSSGADRALPTTPTQHRWSRTARSVSGSCNFLVTCPHCVVSAFTLVADGCCRCLQGLGAAERLKAGFRTFKKNVYE